MPNYPAALLLHKPEPCEEIRCVNKVGCEPFAGCAVARGHTLSLVGGEARMVKAVEDIQGSLADSAAGEIERENRAVGTSFSIRTTAAESMITLFSDRKPVP